MIRDKQSGAYVHDALPLPNGPISNSRSGSSHGSSAPSPIVSSPLSPRGSIRRKLVVVGDGACGKTSLLVAYKDDSFTGNYVPTVFETSTTTVPVESKIVELSLWDTAGMNDENRFAYDVFGGCRTGGLR